MEFIYLFCSLLISLLVVIILKKLKKTCSKDKLLPPGPKKLAFIGNIHQLISGSLPHHTLRNLAKKHGPLMHLQHGEIPVIVISSPEIAKEIFRTHDLIFANRPYREATSILTYNNMDIAFAPYGNLWRQLRKICTLELLTVKRVQMFRSIREEEVCKLIDIISEEKQQVGVVSLSRRIFSLNYYIIARAAFGKRSKYHEEFIGVMDGLIQIIQWISGSVKKVQKAHNQVDKIVGTILKEHKDDQDKLPPNHDHDLVDVLLSIQKHGQSDVPLTDTIIKAVIFDMFAAGGETSSTTMEWTMSELMRNPKIMERAQLEVRKVYYGKGTVDESMLEELKYLQAVVKETLRLHPPLVFIVPRESSEQCNINGYEIPAKTSVFINAWAMGRDPKYWTDADRFEPERFLESNVVDYKGNNFEYVPFGGGRRICPGMSFAIPSIQLSLAQLLFHFDWKLPILAQELDMTEKFGFTVRRKNELPTVYPHSYLYLNRKRFV